MKIGVSFLIAASVLLTVIESAQENKRPSASLQPPSEFTDISPGPTTTTTTTKPTTTTIKPTTTTTKPTTTTTKPTTTTTKPTTTAKTTQTTKTTATTTKMTTSTVHSTTIKPITTPVPGPTPATNATVGNFSYSSGNKLYVMALMVLQIRVNDSKTGGVFTVQRNMTTISGEVTNVNMMMLTLTFPEGNIGLVFQRNTTSKAVYVNSLNLNLTYAFKTGAKQTYTASRGSLELFKAAIGHSYSCKNESIFLGKNIFLDVTQQRLQAFNITNYQFGQPDLCKADQTDYTVAIAVGIVLLILILIVILAYACSRRRRSDGYQSL